MIMAETYEVTSKSIRNSTMKHFKDDENVGKLVKVSHSTVFGNIKTWKLPGTVETAMKAGSHKLTPSSRRIIIHKIKKNPKFVAVKLSTELEKKFTLKLNPETVRRVIRSYGCNRRVAKRKFLVHEIARKLRLYFEIFLVNKYTSFRKTVNIVDESKFSIIGSDK